MEEPLGKCYVYLISFVRNLLTALQSTKQAPLLLLQNSSFRLLRIRHEQVAAATDSDLGSTPRDFRKDFAMGWVQPHTLGPHPRRDYNRTLGLVGCAHLGYPARGLLFVAVRSTVECRLGASLKRSLGFMAARCRHTEQSWVHRAADEFA